MHEYIPAIVIVLLIISAGLWQWYKDNFIERRGMER